MSTTTFVPVSLPAALRSGAVETWRVLPSALAAGAVASATLVPLVVALVAAAPGWLVALTLLPPALAATALAGFARRVLAHEGRPASALRHVDPVLAVLLAAGAALAGALLSTPGALQLVGIAVAAVLALVALPSLAYGAMRDRRGLGALRGGVILALMRPGWALTLTATAVLAGFAVVASAGVLALVAGPFLLGVAAAATAALLAEIDHLQGASA